MSDSSLKREQLLAPLPREIYPTKISWNLEKPKLNKKPSSQIKTSSSAVPKHQNQPDPSFQKTNLSHKLFFTAEPITSDCRS